MFRRTRATVYRRSPWRRPLPNEPEQAITRRQLPVRRWRREECTEHADAEAFFRHLDRLVDDAPSSCETAR
ncbi:hypothetical protein M4D79_02525 [Mycolicibacterium novocastrense]|nr:hypothetical protein M4D79_02525 [Mycolicibacterium novocastrense]